MARKKISVGFTAPITTIFSLLCIAVFLIQASAPQHITNLLFFVGGNSSSPTPFDRTSIFDYLTIFTHLFGSKNAYTLLINTAYILLLSPRIEQAYGKGLLSLMFIITAFITGVLSTLFVSTHVMGAQGIVFLLLLLNILADAKTKTIPITIIFSSLLYVSFITFDSTTIGVAEKITPFIGSLCASIFGFIDFHEQTKPISRKKPTA